MTLTETAPMRLFLVRHAHAGWAQPGGRDYDRGLDERGLEEAARLAASMTLNGFAPELIVCSGARRCAQTLAVLLESALEIPRLTTTDMLYFGTVQTYLDFVAAEAAAGTKSLMLVGHNPMIEETAQALLASTPGALDQVLSDGFPTAGLLILDCPDTASPTDCRFVGLLTPVDA